MQAALACLLDESPPSAFPPEAALGALQGLATLGAVTVQHVGLTCMHLQGATTASSSSATTRRSSSSASSSSSRMAAAATLDDRSLLPLAAAVLLVGIEAEEMVEEVLPGSLAQRVARVLPPFLLGREGRPHVGVDEGLRGEAAGAVRELLGWGCTEVTLAECRAGAAAGGRAGGGAVDEAEVGRHEGPGWGSGDAVREGLVVAVADVPCGGGGGDAAGAGAAAAGSGTATTTRPVAMHLYGAADCAANRPGVPVGWGLLRGRLLAALLRHGECSDGSEGGGGVAVAYVDVEKVHRLRREGRDAECGAYLARQLRQAAGVC